MLPVNHLHPQDTAGAACPSVIEAPAADTAEAATAQERVGAFLQLLAAARAPEDAEIRQHAADCGLLMEAAYARFQEHGDPSDRDEAVLWMHRRHEALRAISQEGKAAREAQIQQAIAAGTGCYFIDAADRDRQGLARRAAGA